MRKSLIKLTFLCIVLTFSFSLTVASQSQQNKNISVNAETPQNIKAKREIIKLLFANIFRGEVKEEIYLSTKNIPSELQNNFPEIENITAQFIDATLPKENICPFVFHSFAISGKKATVSFGNCNDGLGYNFKKVNGKWKFESAGIEKKVD